MQVSENQPQRTAIPAFIWDVCFVFLLLFFLLLVGALTLTIGDTDKEMYGFIGIVSVGILIGVLLHGRKTRPSLFAGTLAGTLVTCFLLIIALYLQPSIQTVAVIVGSAVPVLIGFVLMMPPPTPAPMPENPREEKRDVKAPKRTNLSDRLILIDQTDVENPPCLNLFDFGVSRAKEYPALEREILINGAIAMMNMFSARS